MSMARSRSIRVVSGIALLASFPVYAQSPSFDCSRARLADEVQICSDVRLSELDQAASIAFEQAKRTSGSRRVVPVARAFIATRNLCAANLACILDAQIGMIERYREFGARVGVPPWARSYRAELVSRRTPGARSSGLPRHIGECVPRSSPASRIALARRSIPLAKMDSIPEVPSTSRTVDIRSPIQRYRRSFAGDKVLM